MQSTYFKEEGPKENVLSVGFYNLDNLFDTYDDPETLDDDFTPHGDKKWTYKRYKRKLNNIAEVISTMGVSHSPKPPAIVGLAELENEDVILDLLKTKYLRNYPYDYVHYDSPDERGIDVGLIYNKTDFELLGSERFPLIIHEKDGDRDYTRDVLQVKGKLWGEEVFVLVNHWPSRREGVEESEYKRVAASKLNRKIVDDIREENNDARILIMGDFNDCHYSKSVRNLMQDDFYNPMESLRSKGKGSSVYNGDWYLFDQILVSESFFTEAHSLQFKYASIYDPKFIKTWKGKRKDSPFRTFIGKHHLGGYSDHFPVYAYFEKVGRD